MTNDFKAVLSLFYVIIYLIFIFLRKKTRNLIVEFDPNELNNESVAIWYDIFNSQMQFVIYDKQRILPLFHIFIIYSVTFMVIWIQFIFKDVIIIGAEIEKIGIVHNTLFHVSIMLLPDKTKFRIFLTASIVGPVVGLIGIKYVNFGLKYYLLVFRSRVLLEHIS